MTTWKDLIDHLVDWLGGNPGAEAHRDARRASLQGLRKLASAARWSYLYDRLRVNTVAPYSTGTVAYDHAGGAHERLLTLTSGTWPEWAAQGSVRIGEVSYEVAERKSDTLVTLSVNSNPGADVASTSYTLYRDTYPLPTDFTAAGPLIIVGHSTLLSYEVPTTWLERQRVLTGEALPATYCVRGDPNYQNALAISLFPPPDAAYQIDGVYERRPRDLKVEDYSAGTVSCTAGASTLTGSGTAWASKLVGTVIRLSASAQNLPTAEWGSNPAQQERVVTAVNSATSITVDEVWDETQTAVKYRASDPVDVESGSMLNALLRACEFQLAMARRMPDRAQAERDYERELILAREADSRSFAAAAVGPNRPWPVRLADMPTGADD